MCPFLGQGGGLRIEPILLQFPLGAHLASLFRRWDVVLSSHPTLRSDAILISSPSPLRHLRIAIFTTVAIEKL